MKPSEEPKRKIRIIEKYLKNVTPSGFAHGCQLSGMERLVKRAKKGRASEEEINESIILVKEFKRQQ